MFKRSLHRVVATRRVKKAAAAVGLVLVLYVVACVLFSFVDPFDVWLEVRSQKAMFSWEAAWRAGALPHGQTDAVCMVADDGSVRFRPGRRAASDPLYMDERECRATLARVVLPVERMSDGASGSVTFGRQNITCDAHPCPLFSIAKEAKSAKEPETVYRLDMPSWKRVVRSGPPVPTSAPFQDCPTRYATVQLQGFGRMQNQMQSLVDGMLWSRHTNRTFVLPPLCWNIWCCWEASCRSRLDVEQYYDFSLWRAAGFCVMNYTTYLQVGKRQEGEAPLKALFVYTPDLVRLTDGNPLLRTTNVSLDDFMTPTAVGHQEVAPLERQARQTRCRFTAENHNISSLKSAAVRERTEDWIVLAASSAYFLHFSLDATRQLFGLLRASRQVQARVRAALATSPLGFATVGYHIRHREGACKSEAVTYGFGMQPSSPASPHRIHTSETFVTEVLRECEPTVYGVLSKAAYVAEQLQLGAKGRTATAATALVGGTATYDGLFFLIATDHQSKSLIDEAHRKWVPLYPRWPFRVLSVERDASQYAQLASDVATDFFVLTSADLFFGNRLSSVTQNVCMWRLYNGKVCNSFPGGILATYFQDL